MAMRMTGVIAVSAGPDAQDVDTGYNAFLIQNNGTGNVWFREKKDDGKDADSGNAFCLRGGETLGCVLTAKTLSVAAESECSVRILLLDIG